MPESDSFALYQVQRGTHYLLQGNTLVSEIKAATDQRGKSLIRDKRPKLLFKKYLFTEMDERRMSNKHFLHLVYIQVRARACARAARRC